MSQKQRIPGRPSEHEQIHSTSRARYAVLTSSFRSERDLSLAVASNEHLGMKDQCRSEQTVDRHVHVHRSQDHAVDTSLSDLFIGEVGGVQHSQ